MVSSKSILQTKQNTASYHMTRFFQQELESHVGTHFSIERVPIFKVKKGAPMV